jgi:DNA-binding LacI/PurR family transcriptional regulator
MARAKRRSARPAVAAGKRAPILSIADFARHLNLSAWTVSRAINGHPEVNEKTRRRVLAAMDELGFRPNPLARGLGGRRTGMIGVCFMGLGNPIVDQKVYALQEFFRRHHLQTVLEVRMRDREQELLAIENFRRIHVDGVVLMYSELDAATAVEALKGMPCVQVDPHRPQSIPSVSLDRQKAMRLLMDHLFRLEHSLFGLLGTGRSDVWRWPALLEIAQSRHLDPEKIFVEVDDLLHVESMIERGQLMAQAVLEMKRRPTALLAANDRMAIGVVQTLREAGVSIPREISVTGFDNLDLGRKLHPTLTTIEQNSVQLMERAGDRLLHEIRLPAAERGKPRVELVAPELVIGESTGPAPIPSPARGAMAAVAPR